MATQKGEAIIPSASRTPTLSRQTTATLVNEIRLEEGGGVLNSYLQSYIEILDNDEGTTFKMILALLIWLGDNTNIDIRGFEQLLKGAHIVIDGDNGKLFLEMCKHFKRVKSSYGSSLSKYNPPIEALSSKKWPPQSSHYSEISQEIQEACPLDGNDQLRLGHGIIFNCDDDGNLIDEANDAFDILMGIRATPSKDYAGNSWVQLEYARLFGMALKERAVNFMKHGWGWVKYKVSGKNQGPFGESFYTETGIPYVLKMGGRGGVPSSVINDKREQIAISEQGLPSKYDLRFMLKEKKKGKGGGRRKSRRNKRKNRKRKTKRKSKRKRRKSKRRRKTYKRKRV